LVPPNSDASLQNSAGHENNGGADSILFPLCGRPCSPNLTILLPAVVMFKPEEESRT